MTQRRSKYRPGSKVPGTRYTATRFIGSGAMGAVYEVLHGELDKVFVMKVLHRDLVSLEDPVRRMRSECRLLARIEHPNIVKVTDAGTTEEDIPFFVMERLDGETLGSRMNRCDRWAVNDVVEMAIELLNGLAAAHSLGIVHRDIKPSNIFLTRNSGVKILDFGIAKSFGADAIATARGVTLGTPRYMAPEQATGESADCRADLYALGIILYELLAGDHPFAHAVTPVEMLIAQAGWKAMPLPLDSLDGISRLGVIVARLLSKDPNARPATAAIVRGWLLGVSRELRSRRLHSEAQVRELDTSDTSLFMSGDALRKLEPLECELAYMESETVVTRGAMRCRPLRLLRHTVPWGALVALLLATGVGARRIATSRANPMRTYQLAAGHSNETAARSSLGINSPGSVLVDDAAVIEPTLAAKRRSQPTVTAGVSGPSRATSSSNSGRMSASVAPKPMKVNSMQLYKATITSAQGAAAGGSALERAHVEEFGNLTRR